MEQGWIKIHRKIMDDELYFGERFDKAHAWLDLLLMAANQKREFYKRGIVVKIGVGEVAVSMRELSERWGWYLTGVLNFIKGLEQAGKVKAKKSNVITILQILNWEKYQLIGTQIGTQNSKAYNVPQDADYKTIGTQIGTQKKEKEKNQKKKKDKEENIKSFNKDFSENKFSATTARTYTRVAEIFHECCPSLPKVEKLTDARKAKIKMRFMDEMRGEWATLGRVFAKMEASKFLKGDNRTGWRASFDWIFANSQNWLKVLEGNYDDHMTEQQAIKQAILNPNAEWK